MWPTAGARDWPTLAGGWCRGSCRPATGIWSKPSWFATRPAISALPPGQRTAHCQKGEIEGWEIAVLAMVTTANRDYAGSRCRGPRPGQVVR
jgi:hypothetical protein